MSEKKYTAADCAEVATKVLRHYYLKEADECERRADAMDQVKDDKLIYMAGYFNRFKAGLLRAIAEDTKAVAR